MSADIRWIRCYVIVEAEGRLGTVCIYQALEPSAESTRGARHELRQPAARGA